MRKQYLELNWHNPKLTLKHHGTFRFLGRDKEGRMMFQGDALMGTTVVHIPVGSWFWNEPSHAN